MAMEKQKQIIKLLIHKTSKSEVDWKSTIKNNEFQVSFAKSGLRIVASEGEGDTTDYYIILLNEDGSIVDSFSDVDLDTENREQNIKPKWFPILKELFDSARRTALGSEKIMDDILIELGDIPF